MGGFTTIGPIPTLFTFYAGSGQLLYWYLQDPTSGQPIPTSAITATLYAGRDINNPTVTPGTPVASFSGVTLGAVPGTPGKFQVLIPATFNPAPGAGFVLVVDAVTPGYENMHWEVLAVVQPGTVRVCDNEFVVTVGEFRCDFPEFNNVKWYPDSSIRFWIGVATKFLNRSRWEEDIKIGAELYVAHMIVLEKQASDQARKGGWPGISKGAIASEAAGAVNVGYDTASSLEEGAGHWNLTVYGTRFIRIARMMGAGPIYVGPSFYAPPYGTTMLNAWWGPPSGLYGGGA